MPHTLVSILPYIEAATNALDTFLSLVDRYGLPLFILLFLWRDLIAPMIRSFVRDHTQEPEEEDHDVEKHLALDSDINALLCEMMVTFESQWNILWQFHNGALSLTGVPFLKVSATHERVMPNFPPYAQLFRDMPLSLFADNTTTLIQKGISVVRRDDESADSAIRGAMCQLNIDQAVMVAIHGPRDQLVGVLSIGFIHRRTFSAHELDLLTGYATRAAINLNALSALRTGKKS